MYFSRNWEFGSGLLKFRNFVEEGGFNPRNIHPHPRYVTDADVAAMEVSKSAQSITCYIASCEMDCDFEK
jgi:hypothetical protein